MEDERIDRFYGKVLDIIIMLRETRDALHTYSAYDIKKLLIAKRVPADLRELYRLERMITELRIGLNPAPIS